MAASDAPAVVLGAGDLDALADALAAKLAPRVLELLRMSGDLAPQSAPRLVDARELAAKLNLSRDTIYEHARQLGGERIGSGPRGRLRFDLDRALAAWTSRFESERSGQRESLAQTEISSRRRSSRMGSDPKLLPTRGRVSPADANSERP
jgi:DNA-binding transcriptional ArsR family regulator